jgi:hypothetical protein
VKIMVVRIVSPGGGGRAGDMALVRRRSIGSPDAARR